MQRLLQALTAALPAVVFSSVVQAEPVVLEGNCVKVGVNIYGTLGSGLTTPPGILHDPTCTGDFAPDGIPNDYLTPGQPAEGFRVTTGLVDPEPFGPGSIYIGPPIYVQGGGTNLSDRTESPTRGLALSLPIILTGEAAGGWDNVAVWTSTLTNPAFGDVLTLENRYFFNNNDERVNIVTTIVALQDIPNVYFARALDPDPDVNRFDNYQTTNTRGNDLFSPQDLVSAAGPETGLTIGLLDLQDTFASNTAINNFCCSIPDPDMIFNGSANNTPYAIYPETNFGDYGISIAWLIGDLLEGQSATITYAYVMGDKQSSVGEPPQGAGEVRVSELAAAPNPVAVQGVIDLTATGVSSRDVLTSARWSLAGAEGAMHPADGQFDAAEERLYAQVIAPYEAGIYPLCVQARDTGGNVSSDECITLVVFEPAPGFVTGGGWLWSPPGAMPADPIASGRANFGFVARYARGRSTPDGGAQFVFQAGGLNFHAEHLESLVVNGASQAMFKGNGRVNGAHSPAGAPYQFMIWAGDGQPDTLRIKIWYEDAEEIVVYDNGSSAPIAGGQIVIHTGRDGK